MENVHKTCVSKLQDIFKENESYINNFQKLLNVNFQQFYNI